MKCRFRLYRRPNSRVFYVHDSVTGKQESLGTRDRAEARTLLNARNESVLQLQLNLHLARTYLAGTVAVANVDAIGHEERVGHFRLSCAGEEKN